PGRHRLLEGGAGAPQAHRHEGSLRRQADAGRPAVPRPGGRGGNAADGHRDEHPEHPRRAEGRRRARRRVLDSQGQGHRDPPGHHPPAAQGHRALCAAVPRGGNAAGLRRRAAARRLQRVAGGRLLQHAQAVDLRRLQRNPEEHRLEDDSRALRGQAMDFKLSEEQQMLQDTAARLVRSAYPFEQREKFSESELGFSAEFWSQLSELGLTAVPFAEEFGGFGGSGVETMLVMTELGRGLTLEPYLQSVIFGGGLLSQLGSDAQKQDLLAQVAAGSLQLAVAFEDPQSHYNLNDVQTTAESADGGYRLNGRKAVVIGGHSADAIIVSARTSGGSRDEAGISLFLVDPSAEGVRRRVYPTIDGRKG